MKQCFLIITMILVGSAVTAQTYSGSSGFKSKLKVLDQRASKQYSSSVRLKPAEVIVPGTPAANAKTGDYTNAYRAKFKGKYRGKYLNMAKAAARRHGIPEGLFLRLVQQESGWNPKAKSPKGAYGLTQLMPGTARLLRVNSRVPEQNLDGGARYLAQQYKKFGSWRLALAAYNAGPGAVQKYGGVPPFKETRNYVRVILG